MDLRDIWYISSRLCFGAVAAFFALVLWSKTRDPAWMLVVMGTIAAYIDVVYAALDWAGLTETGGFAVGPVPLAAVVLPNLPALFFIGAFMVMAARTVRRH